MKKAGFLVAILVAVALFAAWYFVPRAQDANPPSQDVPAEIVDTEREASIVSIVSSEELILSLTPELRRLGKSLSNLHLPDQISSGLFSDQVTVASRLTKPPASADENELAKNLWITSDSNDSVPQQELELWNELIASFKFVRHGKFYFVSGSFADADRTQYQSILGSSGNASLKDGRELGWTGKIEATWTRSAGGNDWTISSWKTKSLETTIARQHVFKEMLSDVIDDDFAWSLASNSLHDQKTSGLFEGQQPNRLEGDQYPFFFAETTLEHPSVAVVDIDADGFDDVFVAMKHSRNILLRNKQDGTFEECASRFNLDKTAYCSAAIFADFDNDGDPDLFLGHPRHRGQYLVNESGKFEDRTKDLIGPDMPYMISSISAADYNGDGLLDVLLCTYGPLENIHTFSDTSDPVWAKQYLSEEELARFRKELPDKHVYLRRPGPPNLLLVNSGGGAFEVAKENEQVQLWRQSFQGAWSDFDRDGDPDLYVANDYGPDNFLRNDFPDGFTDITEESGIAIGFGMGVSWNDYNNDGFVDLYVSNMFSKAGSRITAEVAEIDPRFKKLATGNYLYRGDGKKFELVSGTDKNSIHVAKAGWAWGGQFFDFNNDGYNDIYVPNGYYTAPADIAVDIDL